MNNSIGIVYNVDREWFKFFSNVNRPLARYNHQLLLFQRDPIIKGSLRLPVGIHESQQDGHCSYFCDYDSKSFSSKRQWLR